MMENRCPNCGAMLPTEEDASACPACGYALDAAFEDPILFDEPVGNGFFPALAQTWVEATFRPNAFFPRIATSGVVFWPLLYAVLFWWVQAVANFWIQQPLVRASRATLPPPLRSMLDAVQPTPERIIGELLLGPFLVIATILLVSALLHGVLYLLNGARPEFVVTVRAVCYTSGAYVAYLIPAFGPVLHLVWVLALLVIGLARAHETEWWRSAIAVLVPAVACCGAGLLLGLVAAAMALGGAR